MLFMHSFLRATKALPPSVRRSPSALARPALLLALLCAGLPLLAQDNTLDAVHNMGERAPNGRPTPPPGLNASPISNPNTNSGPYPGRPPQNAASQPGGSKAARPVDAQSLVKSRGGITLNFVNAEIEAVARALGLAAGRNVVVDPRVKGTMNLFTDKPVSPSAAFDQFLAALRLQGYTVVDVAGLYKVVPEADARLQSGPVSVALSDEGKDSKDGKESARLGNQLITQIFKLNFENANNLVPILRPLINPNNTINVNPGSNSLVITDYGDNLQRIARIIAALDVGSSNDVEVIALKHVLAADVSPLLTRLLDTAATPGSAAPQGPADSALKASVLVDARSNSLIVKAANPVRMAQAKALIAKLDLPSGQDAAGNMRVVFLKNADAVKLATTLRAALSASTALSTASPTNNLPGSSAPATQPSTGGQIQADAPTNSLIISAAEPLYRQIRAVIDKLDERRAQVLVEALIAEVSSNRAAELGVQWQTGLGNVGDSTVGVLGTNFGSGGSNIVSLSAGAGTVLPSTGANFGVGVQKNGVYLLGFLARALEANGEGNVLSTPNLLTLDNEEAKIVIGQNVPFVTGQYTTNTGSGGGSSVSNPFQTIERKDVGITLKVKPQISENGTVRMTVFQEVSSVDSSTLKNSSGPTTNKRTIETNVLVQDGGVVVLGGLLQDQYSGSQEKVPWFADIPLIGWLFRSDSRSRTKTNLMVFIRPLVLRDANATQDLSISRYELMRAAQQTAQPSQNAALVVNQAPKLPEADLKLKPNERLDGSSVNKALDSPSRASPN
jgi:general secretion pathway protein D